MLSLEGICLAATYLQIKECCQVGDFFLDSSQTDHTVQLGKALCIVDSLRSLVWYVLHVDCHQLVIAKCRDVNITQTLGLLGAYLLEQLTHGTSVGEILVARAL